MASTLHLSPTRLSNSRAVAQPSAAGAAPAPAGPSWMPLSVTPSSLTEDAPLREQILSRVVAPKLEKGPERKGIGVLIRVDRLTEPFGGVSQKRDGTEGA